MELTALLFNSAMHHRCNSRRRIINAVVKVIVKLCIEYDEQSQPDGALQGGDQEIDRNRRPLEENTILLKAN